jgi:hypothetical protein
MIKISRFRFENILLFLLLITPVIDTINGFYILHHGATGISIGTFFRLLIIAFSLAGAVKYKKYILIIFTMLYFPLNGILRGVFLGGVVENLTYAMKWVMVVLLIITLEHYSNKKLYFLQTIHNILWFWAIFVPLSLVIEYVFNIGYAAYFDAGFKGLYYSTNDVAFVLIILFIYSFYNLFVGHAWRWGIVAGLNFIAILILGTKSSLIFAVVSVIVIPVIFGIKRYPVKTITIYVLIVIFAFCVSRLFQRNIAQIFDRYTAMWSVTTVKNTSKLESFFIFATSGRTTRISDELAQISAGNEILNVLFGWIIPDNAHVVEMDFHDLLFQYGIVGFVLLLSFYIRRMVKGKFVKSIFTYMLFVGLLYCTLAGHVISGAFSGTMFALVFVLYECYNKNNLQCNNTPGLSTTVDFG